MTTHARHYARFAGYRTMVNELYLSVVYRPHRTRPGRLFSQAARRTLDDIRHDQQEGLRVIADIASQGESGLKPWAPFALGVYQRSDTVLQQPRRYSASLEMLDYLVNEAWDPVPDPSGRIHDALPTSRLFFQREKLEIRMPAATRYAAPPDLKDCPEETEPGMRNGMLFGDFEYIKTQSFTVLDRPSAKKTLERQCNQWMAGDDMAVSQIEAMDQALNDFISGDFVLGEDHYSLAVPGDTLKEVTRHVAPACTRLSDAGIQSALIDQRSLDHARRATLRAHTRGVSYKWHRSFKGTGGLFVGTVDASPSDLAEVMTRVGAGDRTCARHTCAPRVAGDT